MDAKWAPTGTAQAQPSTFSPMGTGRGPRQVAAVSLKIELHSKTKSRPQRRALRFCWEIQFPYGALFCSCWRITTRLAVDRERFVVYPSSRLKVCWWKLIQRWLWRCWSSYFSSRFSLRIISTSVFWKYSLQIRWNLTISIPAPVIVFNTSFLRFSARRQDAAEKKMQLIHLLGSIIKFYFVWFQPVRVDC